MEKQIWRHEHKDKLYPHYLAIILLPFLQSVSYMSLTFWIIRVNKSGLEWQIMHHSYHKDGKLFSVFTGIHYLD